MEEQAFADWASHVLSLTLGLPEADIKSTMLPHFMTMDKPELAATLHSILGEDSNAVDLQTEFIQRRFQAKDATSKAAGGASKKGEDITPVAGLSYAGASRTASKSKDAGPPPPPEAISAVESSAKQPGPGHASTPPKKEGSPSQAKKKGRGSPQKGDGCNKQAKKRGMSLEQFQTLERGGRLNKDRRLCNCQALRHELLTNCLSCGRILCKAEGAGPCFTCGELVVSGSQQLEALEARRQNQQQKQGSVAQSAQGTTVEGQGEVAATTQQLDAARENTARLLHYDRTSAQRTRVIDVKSDFVAYQGQGSAWLSRAEVARAQKAEEVRRTEIERSTAGGRRRAGDAIVLDLDLAHGSLAEAATPPPARPGSGDGDELDGSTEAGQQGNADSMKEDDYLDEFSDEMANAWWPTPESDFSAIKAANRKAAVKDNDLPGTGLYAHPDLDVRPLYVSSVADDASSAKQTNGNTKDKMPSAQDDSASAEKGHAKQSGKGPRSNRGKNKVAPQSSATPTSSGIEDDPGCG